MGFLPSSLRTEAPTPSEDGGSALLIGTIVGCVGALLLCVAAVAFFVIYRRKQDRQDVINLLFYQYILSLFSLFIT